MISLLVVDDEAIIRNGIASTIQGLGLFDSVDTAKNGIEALELCKVNKYSAILLDIMMPRMNGLEFLEQLKDYELTYVKDNEIPLQTLKVILSGYDEFDYAQKAMALGVDEFLLKPIEPDEVVALAKKLYEKACLIAENTERQKKLRDQVRQSLPLLYEKFFIDLVESDLDDEAIERKAQFLGLSLSSRNYLVAVAAVVSNEPRSEMMGNLAIHSLKTALQAHPLGGCRQLFFEIGLTRCAIIFCFDSSDRGELIAESYLSERVNDIREKDGFLINCGIGNMVQSRPDIKKSYRGACTALMYITLSSEGAVQKLTDEEDDMGQGLVMEDMSELAGLLKQGSAEKAKAFLEHAFSQIESHSDTRVVPDIKIMLTGILFTCLSAMRQKGVRLEGENFVDYYKVILDDNRLHSLSELKKISFELLHFSLSQIADESNNKKLYLVENAKKIVEERSQENLTTQGVADILGLSRNYFGQLFKKEEGCSFSEYLSRVRISKAKKLLQTTTLKIYEVSELVGIDDSFYFSSLFKKYVGCSPSEFREI